MPELGALHAAPGGIRAVPEANGGEARSLASPACTHGRMLIKRNDTFWFTACPMVDDDVAFDRAPDLRTALAAPVTATHRRCSTCLAAGVCYGGA
jgi:hypothetical protein